MTTTNPSLADLLQHFTSPNNDIRHEAEKYYNSLLQTSPDEVVIGLMQIMANEQIPFHIRQLSAILLRRCLIDEEDSYYFKLQLQSRHYVINEISRLLLQEQNTAIRIKITDIAGELGGSILEPKDWPNLYPTMIQLCNVSLTLSSLQSLSSLTSLVLSLVILLTVKWDCLSSAFWQRLQLVLTTTFFQQRLRFYCSTSNRTVKRAKD